MSYDFSITGPDRVISGIGVLSQLPEALERLGATRALLITGRTLATKTDLVARVEETLELLRDRLKASGPGLEPGTGVVLTGGASQLWTRNQSLERDFLDMFAGSLARAVGRHGMKGVRSDRKRG